MIERRCQALTKLSESNERLRQLVYLIAVIEGAKDLASIIPFAGIGVAISGETALEVLRLAAQTIARIQDTVIIFEKASSLSVLKCGLPTRSLAPLEFTRPQTTASLIARATPPLSWRDGSSSSELALRKWGAFHVQSFAHCTVVGAVEKNRDDGALDGEKYATSFKHAPVKRRSKQSLL